MFGLSYTGSTPWATINNENYLLEYENQIQSTWYRAVVKSGSCQQKTSNSFLLEVAGVSTAGVINGENEICQGENAELSLTGNQGNIEDWIKFVSPNWVSTGIKTQNYTDTNLGQTTQYRVIVGNSPCTFDTTDIYTVTVHPTTVEGTVTGQTICEGEDALVILTGNTGDIIRWESSTNGGNPWNTIQETNDTLFADNVSNTKFYRAVVKSGTCNIEQTNADTILVDNIPTAGSIQGAQAICYGTYLNRILRNH
jgi:hypothetical protein